MTMESCNSCVFHDHIRRRKNKNSLHRSQTSTKAHQEEENENVEDIGFGLGFILILQCEFHQNQQYFIAITQRVANWPPNLIGFLIFLPWGQSGP